MIAVIWENHPHNDAVMQWMEGKALAVCPLGELGFLRISSNPSALGAQMEEALRLLTAFKTKRMVGFVPDDLTATDAPAPTHRKTTDVYLASLAARHGMKLATIDRGINHASVEVIDIAAQ